MKGREYNKEEDGTRVSSRCPVVSCRIVLYRRRWNGWKEVGEGRKRSQEQGARSQEPRALRGARSQDQNEQEHPPLSQKATVQSRQICMEKTSKCKEQGQQQERVHGRMGPTQSNPFR